MVIKEGDKFPAGTSFQILGDGGPAVSVSLPASNVFAHGTDHDVDNLDLTMPL